MKNKIAISLSLFLLPACSLSQNPNTSSFSLDLSSQRFAATRHPIFPDTAYVGQFDDLSEVFLSSNSRNSSDLAANRSSDAPQTVGGFSCFGINVTAHDIPSTNADFAANYSDDPSCTYPGISSMLVPASSTGASIQLDVPFGTDRMIQVIGLQSSTGACPAGLLTDHIFDSTITGAYELGRAVGDLTTASSVNIKSRFTPDNLKKPFACPVTQLYTYVVNAGASVDANTGRGSLHGVVQGYKVDRGTGTLTQIPGATQTTHGVIDAWTAIAVSNAGKWLYVYVDDTDTDPVNDGPYGAQGTVDAYNVTTMGAGNGGCGGVSGRIFHNAEIDVYAIDKSTGNLTPVQVVQTGENKGFDCSYGSVAVDPYDQILFVGYGDNVAAYQIDQTTGALQSSPQILSSVAPSNSGFAISPGGNAIYTPNVTNLSGFSITNGASPLAALSPLNYDIDQNGSAPYKLAMNPEGRFMYSANQDTGGMGISQFTVNDDGTLTLIPGPADPGIAYPKILVDPYYGTTLYGADVTRDGVNAFPIQTNGQLGVKSDPAVVPDSTVVNTVADLAIDPWSNFIVAAYDTGHLVTFGLNRDGSFDKSKIQVLSISGASHPATLVLALIPQ